MTTQPAGAQSPTPRDFEYLLNAMEVAGWHSDPHSQGYGDKRKAVFAYVANLETRLSAAHAALADLKHDMERLYDSLNRECAARIEAEAALAEAQRSLKIAELKNRGTLANNLCPDHRDKQVGQPCLACTIETLRGDAERFRFLRDLDSWPSANDAARCMRFDVDGRADFLRGERLVKAIDAALSSTGEGSVK